MESNSLPLNEFLRFVHQSFFQVAAVEWFNKVHSTPPRSQLIARVQYDTRRTVSDKPYWTLAGMSPWSRCVELSFASKACYFHLGLHISDSAISPLSVVWRYLALNSCSKLLNLSEALAQGEW